MNDADMTALDIASAAAKDNPNCAEIVEILEGVGAIRFSLMPKSDTSEFKQVWETDIVNTHMVVASLIATVTFAAIFQIPGGIETENKRSIHYGAAKLAFNDLFKIFIYSDTAAFITSSLVVVAWILRQLFGHSYRTKPSTLCHMSGLTLLVSIFWTVVAFVTALILFIIPPRYHHKYTNNKNIDHYVEYKHLWEDELILVISPPAVVGLLLFSSLYKQESVLKWREILFSRKFMYAEFIILHVVIGFSIYIYSFHR